MAYLQTTDSSTRIAAALVALRKAARARQALRSGTNEYTKALAIETLCIAEVWRLSDEPTG